MIKIKLVFQKKYPQMMKSKMRIYMINLEEKSHNFMMVINCKMMLKLDVILMENFISHI